MSKPAPLRRIHSSVDEEIKKTAEKLNISYPAASLLLYKKDDLFLETEKTNKSKIVKRKRGDPFDFF